MSTEDAASKLRVKEERLVSWEKGDLKPTVNQVRTMARVYAQSFAAFYLPSAPAVFKPPGHDYRRAAVELEQPVSSALALDMRIAMDRREIVLELAAEQGESIPPFSLRASRRDSPEKVSQLIRNDLGISFRQQKKWRNNYFAFTAWRESIENLGVLVFQSPRVPFEEMRGYSIVNSVLPIIVVNRKDSYAGRSFTLFHEMAHLLLRRSGVCDLDESIALSKTDRTLESYCNRVAAATLIRKKDLLKNSLVSGHDSERWDLDDLAEIAAEFSVSQEVVLRRLLTLGRTTKSFYREMRPVFLKQYELLQKQRKEEQKKGFVPPSTDAVSAAGKPYVRSVLGAYFGDRITASDVSDYLGVRLKHIEPISRAVGLE